MYIILNKWNLHRSVVKMRSDGGNLEDVGLPDLVGPVGVHVTGTQTTVTGQVYCSY